MEKKELRLLFKGKFGKAALLVAFLFGSWAYYIFEHPALPPTVEEAKLAAVSQIALVPVEAPLLLITQPDDGVSQLIEGINTAKTSVDLVIYQLQDRQVEQALVDACNRGVKVRVLLQKVSNFGRYPNQPTFDFLSQNGVPVKWAPGYFALTHQKTLIIDSKVAVIMTFNLQSKYYATSRDFGVVNGNPADVKIIQETFNADWDGRQIVADAGKDLVWSPGSAETLLQLIASATATLDIYSLELEDDRIEEAMASAEQRGVAVRLIMTYDTSWKDDLNELTKDGIEARTFASSGKKFIHAKVIVADRKVAFIGSENFSVQSLDKNRELGMLISKPEILSSLQETFDVDWAEARPYAIRP